MPENCDDLLAIFEAELGAAAQADSFVDEAIAELIEAQAELEDARMNVVLCSLHDPWERLDCILLFTPAWEDAKNKVEDAQAALDSAQADADAAHSDLEDAINNWCECLFPD